MSASFTPDYSGAAVSSVYDDSPLLVVDQLQQQGIIVPLGLVRQTWHRAYAQGSTLHMQAQSITTADMIDGFVFHRRFVTEHASGLHAAQDEWLPTVYRSPHRERVEPGYAVLIFLGLTDDQGSHELRQADWRWQQLRDQLLRSVPLGVRRVAYEVAAQVNIVVSTGQPVA